MYSCIHIIFMWLIRGAQSQMSLSFYTCSAILNVSALVSLNLAPKIDIGIINVEERNIKLVIEKLQVILIINLNDIFMYLNILFSIYNTNFLKF